MTHAELLSGPRPAGMPGSTCGGGLIYVSGGYDPVLIGGETVELRVVVYRCTTCGVRIVRDRGGVRNVYRVEKVSTAKV